jgi:DNA-binding SARP family transcriptional activator
MRLDRVLGTGQASQAPASSIQPAVERLGRSLGFDRAMVVTSQGEIVASIGLERPSDVDVVKPLQAAGRRIGEARFGGRTDGRPYTPRDDALFDDASEYFAASLLVGERHAEQAQALAELALEHENLAARGSDLQASLTSGGDLEPLTIHALGPMRVERLGQPIEAWGGPKAGSRQAEAIFAFLFDRRDRGATKDEILEVVWPDVDVPHADLAFHRTLAGLRDVLEPGRPRRSPSAAITFHHDRYHLNPELVAWSDVAEFDALIKAAGETSDEAEAVDLLHRARALYRADFLDDCPFYGEGEYVEESRTLLRGRLVDLLVTLGEREEGRGDTMAAASAFRQALATAGGDCRRADEGLARLGVTP